MCDHKTSPKQWPAETIVNNKGCETAIASNLAFGHWDLSNPNLIFWSESTGYLGPLFTETLFEGNFQMNEGNGSVPGIHPLILKGFLRCCGKCKTVLPAAVLVPLPKKRVFRWHPEHLNRLRTNTRSFETAFGYFRILPQLVPPILQPKPLPSLIPKFILRYPALPIVFWPPLPLVRPNCRAGKESDIFKYMGRTMIAGRLASNPFPTNYPRVLSFHRKPCQQQRKSIIYRFWVMDRDAFFWSDRPQPTINKMS